MSSNDQGVSVAAKKDEGKESKPRAPLKPKSKSRPKKGRKEPVYSLEITEEALDAAETASPVLRDVTGSDGSPGQMIRNNREASRIAIEAALPHLKVNAN